MEQTINFLKNLYQRFQKNETMARGAQLSYFFILSIFPFLIFLVTLINYTPLSQQDTLEQIALLLPENAYAIVEQIVSEVAAADNLTILSLGILGTIWAASRGAAALIKTINQAYDLTESRSFIKLNGLSILATFALALVAMFTLSFLVFGELIGELAFQHLGLEGLFLALWPVFRFVIPLLIFFFAFSLLYIFAPNGRLRLAHVYPGAIFATLFWIVASQAFAFYVNNFGNYSRTYGSIGGIIVFMIWLYLSSIVVLVGGEINATLFKTVHKGKHNLSA